MNTTQPISDIAIEQIELNTRLAQISLDGSEKLIKLNLELAKQLLEAGTKQATELAAVKDAQSAMNLKNKLGDGALDQAVGYARSLYEVASNTQAEVGKLFEERITQFNKTVVSSMDKLAKSAPAGADFAVASAKSSVAAAAAAVDSLTKAAKQVADFTDASVKAATTATVDAVKTAAANVKQ